MKRTLKIIIAVAVLALILNDGGRWSHAFLDLRSSTGQILDLVGSSSGRLSQEGIGSVLGQQATKQQIRVTQYAVTPGTLRIWTEEDVPGTWLIGPVYAMSHGVPFAKAWQTPLVLRYDASGPLR